MEPRGQLGQRDVAALVGQQVIVGLAGVLQLQAVKVGGGRCFHFGVAAHQLIPTVHGGGHDLWIIHYTAVFLDFMVADRCGHGRAVAAVAHHGVDRIRHRDDARPQRNGGPGQLVRVAAAVPPLVMVPHDERHLLELGHLAKDVVPRHGAAAHLLPLGVGQRAGFAQHGVGHRNFADVMGESGNLHRGGVVLAQVQEPGQHHRHSGHPVGMVGSVDIPCVHGGNDALDQITAGRQGRTYRLRHGTHLLL